MESIPENNGAAIDVCARAMTNALVVAVQKRAVAEKCCGERLPCEGGSFSTMASSCE
jgi:hypothetical protein